MFFSIMVPAYNCEKYISIALDSLINQDIPERNYEIIITDDGSTDSTGRICDSYAEKYPFVHVTHTENFGPSHARNVAMPQCRGEYITFCDSDDIASPQLVSVVKKVIETYNHPDIITHSFIRELPEGGWPVYDTSAISAKEYDVHKRLMIYTPINIISKTLVENVNFDEELFFCEDMHWFLKLLTPLKDIRAYQINCPLYFYRMQKGSTTETKSLRNHMNILLSYEKMLSIKGIPEQKVMWLKRGIYKATVRILCYHGPKRISHWMYKKLKIYMHRYAKIYYFGPHSLKDKATTFLKYILYLLGINNIMYALNKMPRT